MTLPAGEGGGGGAGAMPRPGPAPAARPLSGHVTQVELAGPRAPLRSADSSQLINSWSPGCPRGPSVPVWVTRTPRPPAPAAVCPAELPFLGVSEKCTRVIYTLYVWPPSRGTGV